MENIIGNLIRTVKYAKDESEKSCNCCNYLKMDMHLKTAVF